MPAKKTITHAPGHAVHGVQHWAQQAGRHPTHPHRCVRREPVHAHHHAGAFRAPIEKFQCGLCLKGLGGPADGKTWDFVDNSNRCESPRAVWVAVALRFVARPQRPLAALPRFRVLKVGERKTLL